MSELNSYLEYQLYHARLLLKEIVTDTKSDDIHQFRVALRRVRSLISLFLPSQLTFPNGLKSALKRLNPLRELDVLIESINRKEYPKTYKHLLSMKQERLSTLLSSLFYEENKQLLVDFYQQIRESSFDINHPVLIELTEQQFGLCMDSYAQLTSDSPAEEWHKLRVHFKIARYALDFLDAAEIHEERLRIKECKSFQNRFGEIQDRHNQISWLKKLYRRYPNDETKKLIRKKKKELASLISTNQPAR